MSIEEDTGSSRILIGHFGGNEDHYFPVGPGTQRRQRRNQVNQKLNDISPWQVCQWIAWK